MKRRDFLGALGAPLVFGLGSPGLRRFSGLRSFSAPWLLVPMDDVQTDHLKAYGVTYRVLERGAKAEWFLNYRGGSFLLPGDAATAA